MIISRIQHFFLLACICSQNIGKTQLIKVMIIVSNESDFKENKFHFGREFGRVCEARQWMQLSIFFIKIYPERGKLEIETRQARYEARYPRDIYTQEFLHSPQCMADRNFLSRNDQPTQHIIWVGREAFSFIRRRFIKNFAETRESRGDIGPSLLYGAADVIIKNANSITL